MIEGNEREQERKGKEGGQKYRQPKAKHSSGVGVIWILRDNNNASFLIK
jgi:hypothetical protein